MDEPAGVHLPAYLRARPADGRTVPLACANVSVGSAADLQRYARDVRAEIEHLDDGALSLMAAQLDGLRAQSTWVQSADCSVTTAV